MLLEGGEVLTFGYGANNRLGHGDNADQLLPKAVASLRGTRVVEVVAGCVQTAVLTETRRPGGVLRTARRSTCVCVVWAVRVCVSCVLSRGAGARRLRSYQRCGPRPGGLRGALGRNAGLHVDW